MSDATIKCGETAIEERGDVIHIQTVGDMTLEAAQAVTMRVNEQARRRGYGLVVVDTRQMTGFTHEARKFVLADHNTRDNETYFAIVGASFSVRTIMQMLNKGATLLTKAPVTVEFFDTEEAAVEWIGRQHERLKAR